MDTTGSEHEQRRRERLLETLNRIEQEQHSTSRIHGSAGIWVVVAAVETSGSTRGIPQLSTKGKAVHDMQRYDYLDLAIAGAHELMAMRLSGGWALNLATGETRRIHAGNNKGL